MIGVRGFVFPILLTGVLFAAGCGTYTGDLYSIRNPLSGINTSHPDDNPLAGIMQPITLDAPLLFQQDQRNYQINISRGGTLSYARAVNNHAGLKLSAGISKYKKPVSTHAPMYVHIDTYEDGVIVGQQDMWMNGTITGNKEQLQVFADAAVGWFTGKDHRLHNEGYIGIGIGKEQSRNTLQFNAGKAAVEIYSEESRRFIYPYVQDNISIRSTRHSFTWMNRVSMLQYHRKSDSTDGFNYAYTYPMNKTGWLYATGLRVAAGAELIRGFAQVELAVPLGQSDVYWRTTQFSAGLILDLTGPR